MRRTLLPVLLLFVLAPAVPVSAHLSFDLAVDARGNVYLLEVFGNRLMKVAADGAVSELLDIHAMAPGERPHALAIDADGNLYLAGHVQEKVWKVAPSGAVTIAYPLERHEPRGREILHVGVDGSGDLWFMDWTYGAAPGEGQRFRIFELTDSRRPPEPRFECREGGDGFLDFHVGSMIVTDEGTPYFSNSNRIWRLDGDGRLVAVAGSTEPGSEDGPAAAARFASPHGMAMGDDGHLLVAELAGRVRMIDPHGTVTTVAGGAERGHVDGPVSDARFDQAFAVGAGPDGRILVAEYAPKKEYRIRVVSNGTVRTHARIPSDGTFRKAAVEPRPRTETRVYKTVDGTELSLRIHHHGRTDAEPRPAIVFFFGGGWMGGTVEQFAPHAEHLSERGMVAVLADYRVRSRHGVGAFECVADAKSAVRWLRTHAAELGIDGDRIVAAGGSAGGHLAACTALIGDFDEPGEDLDVSSVPNALVLFNPVLDVPAMVGRRGLDAAAARRGEWVRQSDRISPVHHVASGAPPTIVFHGTADSTVPFRQATRFTEAMKAKGNRCELMAYEGRGHGFFNRGRGDGEDFRETLRETDAFLVSLGYLSPDLPTGECRSDKR